MHILMLGLEMLLMFGRTFDLCLAVLLTYVWPYFWLKFDPGSARTVLLTCLNSLFSFG